MSQYTENYHLEKPESNDNFENFRENYNSNMDIIDANLGGGGGGSSVSWSQLQVTGDKIATITVSGIPQDVFAPNSQTFTMAISRANIDSGEDYSTIFGKIKKWFADLKTVAFTGKSSDLNNDANFLTPNDVTVNQIQSTGTKIATIDVDGTSTDLYAPNGGGGGGDVTDVEVDGTSVVNSQGVAEIDLSGKVSKSGDTINGDLAVTGDLIAPYAYIDTLNYHDELTDKDINITRPAHINTGGTIQTPDKGGTMALTSDIHVDDVEVNGVSVLDPSDKIAKITSYKEITRAEYEALPDTKLNDNIAYFITDGGSAKVQGYPPLIYSLAEREVGVWIDGKPLYQKTVHIGNLTFDTNWHLVAHGITNIDNVISCEGIMFGEDVSNKEFYPLPTYRSNTQQGIVWGVQGASSEYVAYINNWYNATNDVYATLRYTKTTDTAGSGIWNGQGGLAHHYSTSETVIGTWIDGKPLYEITLNPTVSIGSNTFNHGIANFKECISIFGKCRHNDTAEVLPLPYVSTNTQYLIACGNVTPTTYLVETGNGFSSIQDCYVTIQYTKTTD